MKRGLIALLSIIILIPAATSLAGVCSDANGDGKVDLLN
jgi:hypothetical protein